MISIENYTNDLDFKTYLDFFKNHVASSPNKTCMAFYNDDGLQQEILTYKQFDEQTDFLAKSLVKKHKKGERALLLFPPGLDFAKAFFACMKSGIVAVPAYPPMSYRNIDRLLKIISDSEPSLVLSVSLVHKQFEKLENYKALEEQIRWINVDRALSANAKVEAELPVIEAQDLCFIQYTSGSTSDPKGVLVSHENLVANQKMSVDVMGSNQDIVMASWLPVYHDMGLIGGILYPLFLGGSTHILAPASFLKNPSRWMQLVTSCRATVTGGPNFSYELLARRFDPSVCADNIDLSTIKTFYNGAEPIRAESYEKLYQKLKAYGLKKQSFFSCYGMAENTLLTSGGYVHELQDFYIDDSKFAENIFIPTSHDGYRIASSGHLPKGCDVKITDPESGLEIKEKNKIGEIVISGKHVTKGYWKKPSDGYFYEINGNAYVKSGDLGVFCGTELVVCGRLKDLIILNGKNYYPQDIERFAEESFDQVVKGSSAAFQVSDEDTQVVLVSEVKRIPTDEEAKNCLIKLNDLLVSDLGLSLAEWKFVKKLQIPKTSSGKVQRSRMKKMFLDGVFETSKPSNRLNDIQNTDSSAVEELKLWLDNYCAKRINFHLANERKTFPPNVFIDFGQKGLMGMIVPKEYGGLGFNLKQIVDVLSVVVKHDLSLAIMVGLNNIIGIYPILRFANEEQKRRLLPKLATGQHLACFAITEEGAGSNPLAITSKATLSSDASTLMANGEKIWIGSGSWSQVMNLFLKEYDHNESLIGISGFVVDSNQEGIFFDNEIMTFGVKAMVQNTVRFEGLNIENKDRLGKAGEGTKIAYETMKLARFGLGMLAVEVMNRALSEGIAYASERNISSGVLISNTYIRSKFAYFQTARDAFSEYLNEQFNFLDMFKEIPELSALLSKIHGAELAFECVDFVMQIMGGRGYSLSSRVPNLYQDLRLLRVFEGPTEALLDRLGSICLKEESYMISNKRILKFLAHNSLKEHSSFKYLIARAYIVDCLYSKSSAEFFDIEMAHLKLFAQQLMLSKDLTQESSHFLTDKDDLIKEFLGPKMPTAKALSSNLETPVRSAKRIYKVTESSNSIEPISKPKIETQAASDKSLEKFIETWLVSHKKITGVEAQNITDNTRFTELGIDSLAGMDLIYALEKEYGVTIPESALWDYPSPKQLSDFIEKSKKQKRPN